MIPERKCDRSEWQEVKRNSMQWLGIRPDSLGHRRWSVFGSLRPSENLQNARLGFVLAVNGNQEGLWT